MSMASLMSVRVIAIFVIVAMIAFRRRIGFPDRCFWLATNKKPKGRNR